MTDTTILVDASTGAVTIAALSAGAVRGKIYNIVKTDSAGNAVIFDPNVAETINGATTKQFTTQYASMRVQSDGTQWVSL